MDYFARLQELKDIRGWSSYRIAQEAGLSANTVANIYKRNTLPSLITLEAICSAFGISLSQFFNSGDDVTELIPELEDFVEHWSALSQRQRDAVWQVVMSYEIK